jgi:UV DNA damage endonuclease
MVKNHLGYACINMGLNSLKKEARVTTNRAMIKKTFNAKGLSYASELSLKNCKDLIKILRWNVDNNIRFFRISSNIFPWASEYNLKDLPDYHEIEEVLFNAGEYIEENNLRITSHPGPFNKLTSPKENVIQNTIKDLEHHAEVFDMLCLSRSHYNKINIHVGAAYDDKQMAVDNFCKNFERLSDGVKSRLTVENDDRESLYSAVELYSYIYKRIGVPIVFDYHHHSLCTGGLTEQEGLELSLSTWGEVIPVCHYSESRSEEYNDNKIKACAHSDSYKRKINTYGNTFDIMLEAKHKELALFKMRELTNCDYIN